MPGVVFLIVVPTANFERELIQDDEGTSKRILPVFTQALSWILLLEFSLKFLDFIENLVTDLSAARNHHHLNNINLPEHNKAILRLEVELRDKNAPKYRRGAGPGRRGGGGRTNIRTAAPGIETPGIAQQTIVPVTAGVAIVPMEKVRTVTRIDLQGSWE